MAKPIPVLLMTRSLGLGGSERQLAEIAQALDPTAFEPHVGCFHAEGFRAEELRAAGVPVAAFPVRSFVEPSVLTGAIALGRYLQEHRIQLLHTFDVPLNLFGVPVARLFRTPRVLSSQRASRALTPSLRRHLLRLTDQWVDGIVVNSEFIRRELIEEDRVPARKIHLCHNGLDAARFPAAPRTCEGPLVIGTICALRPEKGLDTLIEAFASLIPHANASLQIIGSGSVLPELQALAAKTGLGHRCRFEPATQDVAASLRGIDVFVLPSRTESFSNSLMEAMAAGCCVVASRTGGNPELVADQETGLLFRPGDPADLTGSLNRLLQDEALRTRLGSAAAQRIRTQFTIARAAEQMAAIYENLLGRSL